MRIQHNIMAMNAYRNYNTNTSALSKNLEKLSSGYKINRAGDDAAGLAISEKMRAQITGLNAASKNVKDGISLVKTAEGAMQEIQDMLNRMDYLATQSANGTYDDPVDRLNLQKEVDALKTEINRIAESANFNGIKLLDGSLDPESSQAAADAAQAAADAAAEAAKNVAPEYSGGLTADEKKDLMLDLVAGGGPGSAADVGNNTVLETDKVPFQKPSFQVSLNGVTHVMGSTNGTDDITLTVGGTDISITEADIAAMFTDKKVGDTVTSEELAQVFAKKIETTGAGGGTPAAGQFVADDDADSYIWTVRQDGENLVFEFDADNNTAPTEQENKHFDVTLNSDVTKTDVAASSSKFETGSYTAGTGTDGTNANFEMKVTLADGTEATYKTADLDADAAAADVKTALENAVDANGNKLGDLFTITEAGGKFTFTSKATGAAADKVTAATYTAATNNTTGTDASVAADGAGATAALDAYSTGTTGYVNYGTEVVITGVPAESDQLASTTLDFTNMDITDGMTIKLGDEEYTFAVGKDSVINTEGKNVINLTDYTAEDLKAGGDAAIRAEAFSKLSEAAADNKTFTVSHQGTDQKIGLKQKAEVKDTTDMTTLDKFASYIDVKTVDTEATAAKQAEADKKAADLQAAADEAKEKIGKPLTLQIGDTSDSFNQMTVSIGNMHVSAMGTMTTDEKGNPTHVVDGAENSIEKVDISSLEGAQKAIDVVKNAINYVSGVRGDLGAIQNRLEHTANNLSVMTENIQDAESTIRDTDIAEEMMAYTKNNILIQSAQAMLAQANAVPQGVLQLLG